MPSNVSLTPMHAAFAVVEHDRRVTAAQLMAGTAPQASGLLRPALGVQDVIEALLTGSQAGVPVLLDRASGLEPPIPAAGFCVGILTSGTTGTPKCTWHTMDRLMARAGRGPERQRWLLTYSPHSYAGLQVILHAMVSGAELVSGAGLDAATLVRLAMRTQPQAISATPSFWRMLLMALAADADWQLSDIVLGGEAVDDALLGRLRKRWPQAGIRHIYASSEAGSVFSVKDGRAGFPAAWLDHGSSGAGLRVVDGMLHVSSPRAAQGLPLWHATGDLVEVRGDRVMFLGRADGMLNIGGEKVDLEQLEAKVLSLPSVSDARIYGRANPMTGFLVEAEIVAVDRGLAQAQLSDLKATLRAVERPRRVHFVEQVTLGVTGKKCRRQ